METIWSAASSPVSNECAAERLAAPPATLPFKRIEDVPATRPLLVSPLFPAARTIAFMPVFIGARAIAFAPVFPRARPIPFTGSAIAAQLTIDVADVADAAVDIEYRPVPAAVRPAAVGDQPVAIHPDMRAAVEIGSLRRWRGIGRLRAHSTGEQHRSKRSECGFHNPLPLMFHLPVTVDRLGWFPSTTEPVSGVRARCELALQI